MLAVLACQGFTLAITGVSAPWLMESFGLDQAAMARQFAWLSLSALGTFGLARAADRIGRRPILMGCLGIGALASIGAALATSLPVFIACDIVVVAAAGASVACGVVWIAEGTSRRGRAAGQGFAGIAVVLGSGPAVVLMPWLAGTSPGWRVLFGLSALSALLIPLLPHDVEPEPGESPRHQWRLLDPALRARATALILTTILSTIATATVDAWRYVHMVTDVGLSPAAASTIVIVAGVVAMIGFPIGTLASNRLGRIPTAAAFLVLMTLAISWSFFGPPPLGPRPWVWFGAGFILVALAGNAITVASNTAINELFPSTFRATIFGGLNVAGAAGRVAAQTLVAVMASRLGSGAMAVAVLALAGLPAAALLVWLVPDTLEVRDASSSAPPNRSIFRSPVLARVAVAMVTTVLAVLALEGGVRWLAPRAVMVPWQDDIRGVTAPKPAVQGRFAIAGRFDTTVTFRDRFRSRHPVNANPERGVVRIAVLGDSGTFGWGAEDDETYPAVLERRLQASGIRAEVLNAGVIGTGTGEQALWHELWVKRFRPAVVVLTVFWNDLDDDLRGGFFERADGVVRPRPFEVLERGLASVRRTRTLANRTPGFSWLSQHSQLLTWVRQAPTEMLVATHARAVGAGSATSRPEAFSAEDHDLLRGEIRWLRTQLDPKTTLAIVFVPSAEHFDPRRAGAELVRRKSVAIVDVLREVSAQLSIPFLDVRPRFSRESDPTARFFPGDPHPNPMGYELIGETVAEHLVPLVASIATDAP